MSRPYEEEPNMTLGFSNWNVSDSEPLKEEPNPRLPSEGCDLSPQWLHVHAWKG